MEPPALEDLYDPAVIDAIDGDAAALRRAEWLATGAPERLAVAPRHRRGFGGAAASVALTTALVTGVREIFEPDANGAYEEIDDGVVGGAVDAVNLFFVPNNPHATRAIVRPWLLPTLTERGVAS